MSQRKRQSICGFSKETVVENREEVVIEFFVVVTMENEEM